VSFDAKTLYNLLPAIYRIRDAEQAAGMSDLLTPAESTELAQLLAVSNPTSKEQERIKALREKASRGPLESLLAVFAEQIGVVEENLEQLYDDFFIETCADWVVPYIGDLIGYQSLHSKVPAVASPRAEVAHTIALRRRKGTATVLEQLARDVTRWNARAVEFFELLATTQYMNHPRPHSRRCPDLRDGEALEWIGTAFESASRSVDVRRIESGRGRHNIPNVGVFLWRIDAYRHSDCPAVRVGPKCYRVSPLNHDVPLYGRPQAEEEITHLAEPFNVPLPLSRRRLHRHLDSYYGEGPAAGEPMDNASPSLILKVNRKTIERDQIDICNLSGADLAWSHIPEAGRYAIDPQLGRVALPPEEPDASDVRVTWHEGFSADLGGGEYPRGDTLSNSSEGVTPVRVPDDQTTLARALTAIGGNGLVVITDNGRYEETPVVNVAANGTVEIRAANGRRPTLVLQSPMTVKAGEGGSFVMNGLQVISAPLISALLTVPAAGGNALAGLKLVHCTLVPGLALNADGQPTQAGKPSLVVEIPNVIVKIERSIVGGVRAHERSTLDAKDSVIDATDEEGIAYAAPDGNAAGAKLSLEACTVVGKIHAREIGTVSNSILFAARKDKDTWPAPVRTERKQVGCVRFSFVPFDAVVPARYRCQPDSLEASRRIAPRFTSLRYGTPAYCQLAVTTPDAVRRGAEDESEMGVFHHLYGPQRETNLRVRLREYLRVGLEAGIFYES